MLTTMLELELVAVALISIQMVPTIPERIRYLLEAAMQQGKYLFVHLFSMIRMILVTMQILQVTLSCGV